MKSPRKALFIAMILLSAIIPFNFVAADPSWLAGWDYRVKITIDSGDVETALTDFPILIYLSDSSGINDEDITFVFDEVGANYLKIAVTTSNGVTECYVEVEKWDSGNEKCWLWAKIPSISNITDTEIYLYYDNEHADNTDKIGPPNSVPAENVWDANFEFVSHMRDDPGTSNIRDSTANDVDGTKKGANEPAVTSSGMMDDAQDFDGANDYITTPSTIFEDDTVGVIEVWAKRDTLDQYGIVIQATDQATGSENLAIMYRIDDTLWVWVRKTAGYEFLKVTDNSWRDTDWHYFAFIQNGTYPAFYVDGFDEPLSDVLGPNDNTAWFDDIGAVLDVFAIGMDRDSSPGYSFPGILDEVRVSNIDRNGEWIKATYETGRDHILDFGSEQEAPIPYVPTKLFGAGFNNSSPYVSLYWGSNLTNVDFFEVQNSTDKISWGYLGSNTTTEYHDFQVVNGTERYYRVRACNLEGGDWFNSSWSDINFEKVYFVLPVGDGACEYHVFNASSIEVITGTLDSGNLASTYFVDGDWYNVTETNTPPGIDIRFNFTNIGGNITCGCVELYQTYTGHSHHEIQIQAWNFTSASWHKIGEILFNETADWVCIGLGHTPEHYLNNGTVWFRFYHPLSGHLAHTLNVDLIDLRVVYAELCPAIGAAARPEGWVLTIMIAAIGIPLIILGTRRRRR